MFEQWNPVRGNLVHWINGPPKNMGLVTQVSERTVTVQFDFGEMMPFAWPSNVIERFLFRPGDRVQLQSTGEAGVVLNAVTVKPLAIYQVSLPSGTPNIGEMSLRLAIVTNPIELLRQGELHNARKTNLRITATRLLFDFQFNEFSSLSNSRVEIKPHQVSVLHRVVTSYPHRFLLADEVGLGKTIEAGMIIKELKARGLANRVLILAPSGLVGQWQMEMRSKFGLVFSQYTPGIIDYLQGKYPNENVWTVEDNVISSTTYASLIEDRRRAIASALWDLVIIDEAHHARRWLHSENELTWTETNLYKLAAALAKLETGGTTGLLLLTATPMQLHQFELYSLIDLLDPTLFANYWDFDENRLSSRDLNITVKQIRKWTDLSKQEQQTVAETAARCIQKPLADVTLALQTAADRCQLEDDLFSHHRLSEVLIRNRKATVGGFMPRTAVILEVKMTDKEIQAYNAVRDYASAGYTYSEKVRNYTLGFVMTTFQKLNSSSSQAIKHSLLKRIKKLRSEITGAGSVDEISEEDLEEKIVEDALGDRLGLVSRPSVSGEIGKLETAVKLFDSIKSNRSQAIKQSLLKRIAKLRSQIAGPSNMNEIDEQELEEKSVDDVLGDRMGVVSRPSVSGEIGELERVVKLFDSIKTDSKAKVLIEKLDELVAQDEDIKVIIFTQFRDTQEYIKSKILAPWTVSLYYGALKPEDKDNVVWAFREGKGPQVMISTEAGGEGRNFQFCHIMVNYDLPWNPMKVEQRIGRLDRIGQKQPVTILNFKLLGTIEEHVLDVLDKRIKVFEETIGGLDPILGEVENEIKNILLRASRGAELALSNLGMNLEHRVVEAKKAERQLADLIVDAKSFRQDEVKKLLEHHGTLDNKTMQCFILGILKELEVSIRDDPELAKVFTLRYSGRFFDELPKFKKGEPPERVTFDPSVAIDYETIDFLAFGHKLVETLVDYVRSSNYLAKTSYRIVKTDEKPPIRGWFFTYVLMFECVTPHKELFPVFMDVDGKHDDALSAWLLDRSCLVKREVWEAPVIPSCDESFERAVIYAESRALKRFSERQEELDMSNVEKWNQQRAKLQRAFDHRQKAMAAKLDSVAKIFERVSASGDSDVQKIVPVWAKNLENAKNHMEQIEKDKAKTFSELDSRKEISGKYEILTASFVEIVSEASLLVNENK